MKIQKIDYNKTVPSDPTKLFIQETDGLGNGAVLFLALVMALIIAFAFFNGDILDLFFKKILPALS